MGDGKYFEIERLMESPISSSLMASGGKPLLNEVLETT